MMKPYDKVANGERLKEYRTAAQLSIENAAADIGISAEDLKAFESGKKNPSDDLKVILANYYGVSVQILFFPNYVK